MSEQEVLLHVHDGVATITLNRPQALNALAPTTLAGLAQALGQCQDPKVRAVVLTGAGRGFCAGADVRDFVQAAQAGLNLSEKLRDLAQRLHEQVVLPMRRLPKPVVAAVNGVAAGAGFSIALACDLRIAAQEARFVLAYANIGLTADGGSTFYLPRLVGQARAMEMYLLNEALDAQEALKLGLASQVVQGAELRAKAQEVAQRLAQGPTAAYGSMKRLLDETWVAGLAAQLDAEATAVGEAAATRDFREGIQAFAEKRPARFGAE